MKYKGIELKEITKSQIFDPPKKMIAWNDCLAEPEEVFVYAIGPSTMIYRVRTISDDGLNNSCQYMYCAEIPEEPKPRRATNRELAKWLAQGNGQKSGNKGIACISYSYGHLADDCEIDKNVVVRKWDDTEWHEPDVQYMGIEE